MNCKVNGFLNGFISRGVKECHIDASGHLIFTMTDGEELDLGFMGPRGTGIANVTVNEDGTLTINYDDGESETVGEDVYSALHALVEQAEDYKDDASVSATAAENSATAAASSASNAYASEQALEAAIVENPGSIVVDPTLTIAGAAAEAQAVGSLINQAIDNIKSAVVLFTALAKNKIVKYDGALSTIRSDSSADIMRIYAATTSGDNNDRLMYHDGTQWQYMGSYKYDDVERFIPQYDYQTWAFICACLLKNEYVIYFGNINNLNSEITTDKTKIYILRNSGSTNHRITYYNGTRWVYIAEYKITDFDPVYRIIMARQIDQYVQPRINKKILQYDGGLNAIRNDWMADKTALYTIQTTSETNDRLVYYDGSTWQFTNPCFYRDDITREIEITDTQSKLFAENLLVSHEVENYSGGLTTLNNDQSVNHSIVYIAHTSASDTNNKIMYYNGYSWSYLGDYKITDFPQILNLVSYTLTYGPVDNDMLPGIVTVLGYNKDRHFFNFAFVTDTHSNDQNSTASKKFMSSLEAIECCNAYIHGGDLISGYSMNKGAFINELTTYAKDYKKYGQMLFAKGNHDNNHSDDPSEEITNAQYQMIMQTGIDGAVFNPNDPDSCYYYKDYTQSKTRIIVMDSFTNYEYPQTVEFNSEQLEWLYSVALDVNDGWFVIVVSHMVPGINNNFTKILQAFNDRGTQYGNYIFEDDKSTYLIGVIHGHTHADEYDNTPGYNVIGVLNGYAGGGAVDIFTVDTAESKLYETRFGSGSSRTYTFGTASNIST